MSVTYFDAEELGMVAAVAATGSSLALDIADICEELAVYAVSNYAAFNGRYDESEVAPTADEIAACAAELGTMADFHNASGAASTVALMRYNLDASATVEALHAIITITMQPRITRALAAE
tara:strand:+ start:550 stop:912 length:363 start_codon:yes stop_codon:yes gene_type:complete